MQAEAAPRRRCSCPSAIASAQAAAEAAAAVPLHQSYNDRQVLHRGGLLESTLLSASPCGSVDVDDDKKSASSDSERIVSAARQRRSTATSLASSYEPSSRRGSTRRRRRGHSSGNLVLWLWQTLVVVCTSFLEGACGLFYIVIVPLQLCLATTVEFNATYAIGYIVDGMLTTVREPQPARSAASLAA